MIPAAFDYLRAHTADEAFAHLAAARRRGACAGRRAEPDPGDAFSPRASRPSSSTSTPPQTRATSGSDEARWRSARIARDSEIERAPWIGDAAVEPDSRRVARRRRSGRAPDGHGRRQPVPQRSGRRLDRDRSRSPRRAVVRARPERHPRRADRRVSGRQLHDRGRRRRDGARRRVSRCPTIARAGSYQKIERKVGDFATAAAAVQVSLEADGAIRNGGHRALGRRAVRGAGGTSRATAGGAEADGRG